MAVVAAKEGLGAVAVEAGAEEAHGAGVPAGATMVKSVTMEMMEPPLM